MGLCLNKTKEENAKEEEEEGEEEEKLCGKDF